jgi:hypothetical protein
MPAKRPALSIRQPYAELILQGEKRCEFRSRATHKRGRVYVYAGLQSGAEEDFARHHLRRDALPTGVIVGTVEITDCTGEPGDYQWHLANPKRLKRPRKPKQHPQPTWFYPFYRDQEKENPNAPRGTRGTRGMTNEQNQ